MKNFLLIIIATLCVLISCNNKSNSNQTLENETSEKGAMPYVIGNLTPEDVYNMFENADFFVIEHNVVCLRESNDGWVQNLDFTSAERVGTIERSGINKDWEAWDATLLEIGAEIFIHPKRTEAYIVKTEEGENIFYIAMLEG